MKRHISCILLFILLCVSSASLALGPSLIVTASGGGSFAVQGENMNGVAGIELTMGYDTSLLASPAVTWGSLVSGAMSVANTSIPGSIRIAIIRTEPLSGSGPIASVTFATQNNSGGITSVSAKLIDSTGTNLPAQVSVAPAAAAPATAATGLTSTPGVPFSQPSEPPPAPTTATAETTAPATTATGYPNQSGLGTVTMSAETRSNDEVEQVSPKTDNRPGYTAPEAAEQQLDQHQPDVEKAPETIAPEVVKQTVYSGVVERFRMYQGAKTPENMVALFSKAVSPSVRQEPDVVVSDGKATVRVVVDSSATNGTSTSFALIGAKLVSLKKEDNSDSWVLDALPQANSLKGIITILNSRSVIEFPLTVVPPVAAVSAQQADFAAFLKDSGAKSPIHDLNGDGLHDYLDDFIYTAHYLIATRATAKKTK